MPAAESVHVGASGRTRIWDLIIIPPEPGLAYLFSCSSHEDSYADFEAVFGRAIETLRIGEGAPGAPAESQPTVDTTGCTHGCMFRADVTVPDDTCIEAGQQFVKTWVLRNAGSCEWGLGYRLTFVDGDHMGGPDSVEVPPTEAGQDADISVQLVAPGEAGQYRGYWQMCVDGAECFGDRIYVQIISSQSCAP